jgi:hypothetical protein
MTGVICEEYLRWLNSMMRRENRKVLLLMDNFSGHELAVDLVGGLQGLSNIRIAWLPKNTTSVWQPMDQGIIASFKLQYRRQWVKYMIREHEAGRNPHKTVTLLKAIQWSRVAWENDVFTATIQKCWVKSTLIPRPIKAIEDTGVEAAQQVELEADIGRLPIENPLPIAEFLTPDDELVVDTDEDIFQAVVDHHTVEDVQSEDEQEEVPKVNIKEAIAGLEALRLWQLQNGDDEQEVKHLDRMERVINDYRASTAVQTTLDRFFVSK